MTRLAVAGDHKLAWGVTGSVALIGEGQAVSPGTARWQDVLGPRLSRQVPEHLPYRTDHRVLSQVRNLQE